MSKQSSPSKVSATKTIHAAFKLIKENGGSMALRDIFNTLRTQLKFSEWEKAPLEKTGNIRWESIFYWYSVDTVKAGFLVKNNGVWSLTTEGEKAMKAGPDGLMEAANKAYRAWAKSRQKPVADEPAEDVVEGSSEVTLQLMEERAEQGIVAHLRSQNEYAFQDLVAALLRAMGYHTPFIAPKGRDGGVDIIAYADPLGFTQPRTKVQVKHWPDQKIPPDQVRSLIGKLKKDGDVALFVTSGEFTNESMKEARNSHAHCELIDRNRFITLWQEYYHKMPDEDKARMPLKAVWFLGNTDQS